MTDLKKSIIDTAHKLILLLDIEEDDSFVEEIINCVYDNDTVTLEVMREQM